MKKSATQLRLQTLDPDAADRIAAGVMDEPATTGAAIDQDLTQLVWKYFSEEIRESLREVQESFEADQRDTNNT